MDGETGEVVRLPRNFIGVEDDARLESFGAHLISHGLASRWHWASADGFRLAFLIVRGGATGEELLARIGRDSDRDCFYAQNDKAVTLAEGSLEKVMTAVARLAGRKAT